MDILSWLSKHFNVSQFKYPEVTLSCPRCGHPRAYFNVSKRIGYCHKAQCRWSPNLRELIKIVGYGPDQDYIPKIATEHPAPSEVVFPEYALPLVQYELGRYVTNFPLAVEAIAKRGISHEDMYHFSFKFDGTRVYIPVYEDGKLVQYVGRLAWWRPNKGLRYKYFPGVSIAKYLFGWDTCKLWDYITLVENTFVSLWLRKHINCTANFGSHLSKEQIRKISSSNVKKVYLLWDEGTEAEGERVVNRLRRQGINAIQGVIKGQPDDYSLDQIKNFFGAMSVALEKGKKKLQLTQRTYNNGT